VSFMGERHSRSLFESETGSHSKDSANTAARSPAHTRCSRGILTRPGPFAGGSGRADGGIRTLDPRFTRPRRLSGGVGSRRESAGPELDSTVQGRAGSGGFLWLQLPPSCHQSRGDRVVGTGRELRGQRVRRGRRRGRPGDPFVAQKECAARVSETWESENSDRGWPSSPFSSFAVASSVDLATPRLGAKQEWTRIPPGSSSRVDIPPSANSSTCRAR
jgi:hypothetical protein